MQSVARVCSLLILLVILSQGESRRGGGFRGGGFRSGSSSRSSGGWFSRSSSRSSSSRSSSSRGNGWASGGSSGSYPKQQWGSGGRTSTGGRTPIGGGGFVNPKVTSYGSTFGGSSSKYSYKSPGYGTKFGTSFPGGVGKYGGSGFGKKALGLGVGAGFLGGAALGVAGTALTMGVYHRYMQYRMLTYGWGFNPYYNNYYYNNQCFGGCPWNAHCEWGFCECNRGYDRRYGQCVRGDDFNARPSNFDPFVACGGNGDCQKIDINMICNTNLTIQQGGKCECRQDMKWNTQSGECQLYLDVDCSKITYDSKPSSVVLEAVNKTLDKLEEAGTNETKIEVDDSSKPENATISASPNATLANSLLSSIDPDKASKDEIKEAFCRDVDSFSWEFAQPERYTSSSSGTGSTIGMVFGILAAIVLISICCCCCVCKGAKDKMSKMFKSDNHDQGGGVTFSSVQNTGDHSYPPSYPNTTNYNNGYSSDPPSIPPTQPGYNNYPPAGDNNLPYPPQYTSTAPPYPPQPSQPYPPANNPPYPPAAGFNPGPHY